MLLGNDMVDVEDEVRDNILGKMAIFAAFPRSLSDKFAGPGIHALVACTEIESSGFGLHETDDFRIIKIRPILGVLFLSQSATIRLLAEVYNALTEFVTRTPIHELLRRLSREPTRSWVEELV